ncbi:MAG TPA: DinB family protein [Bryobacteraceae bacterium]|jgi:uncharacterized damage-inducible protein DinB|nr:DinB family protein [Bryobacteraceae bacterium]
MNIPDIAITHLRYHRWATMQVMDESAQLPSEQLLKNLHGSFLSIYDTLVHLYQADSIWLDRLHQQPTGALEKYAVPGCMYEFRDAWTQVQDKMLAWAQELDEQGWQRTLSYRTRAGVPYDSQVWQIILHVVNHGTHHRGQVTTMLRQLGIKPLNLDLIAFYRNA